jgi:hypothetical protein
MASGSSKDQPAPTEKRAGRRKSIYEILDALLPDPPIGDYPRSNPELERATEEFKASLQQASQSYLKGGHIRSIETVPDDERLLFSFSIGHFGLSIREAISALDEIDDEFIKFCCYAAVYELVQSSLKIGYFLKAAPFSEATTDLGRIGGRTSGLVRQKEAAETWQPHAIALAKASRKENPGMSQDAVAEYIIANWKLKVKRPGHSRLKQFVGHLIDLGELPRKFRQ